MAVEKSHEQKCSEFISFWRGTCTVELAGILMLLLFIREVQRYKQDYLPISDCHFNNCLLVPYLGNVGL